MAPDLSAGRAYVEVVPSLKDFHKKNAAEMRKAGAEARKAYDDGFSSGRSPKVPAPDSRQSREKGREAGSQFAGAFDREVRAKVTAALKSLPDAKIGADSSEAEREVAKVRASLERLSKQRIGIDVDEATALNRLETLQRKLAELGASDDATIGVKANTTQAAAELDKVRATAERVGALSPTITVDADTASAQAQMAAVGSTSVSASAGVSGLVAAGLLLGPALVPGAAAATAAIVGLGGAGLAAATGVGVAALALSGVADAVKAQAAAEDSAAADSEAASAQRVAAAQKVETAQQSLGDAVRAQSDQSTRSARAVADAEKGVADARRAATDGVQAALARVRSAEANQTRAVQDAENAQEALTDAREAARRGLQDLQDQLRDGQLSERQAVISLQRAKQALSEPMDSGLDRKQAELDYDQAKANLQDIRSENKQLAADKKKADREGIAGSDQVQAAQQRLADAQAKQGQAGRDLATAEADVTRAREDGARRVADAQQKLTDAVSAQSTAATRSAQAVARAQRDVAKAQREASAAADQTSTAQTKAADAMDGLSPAGQKFAKFILSLRSGLKSLRDEAATGFLPGLQRGMEAAGRAMAPFRGIISSVAREMGRMSTAAGKGLGGPEFQRFFTMVERSAVPTLRLFGDIMGNLGKAFAGLAVAFEPVSTQVLTGLRNLTARFAAFANEGEGGGLSKFVNYIREQGPKVAAMIGSLSRAFGHVLVAIAPFGEWVVGAIKGVSDQIARLPIGVLRALIGAVVGVTLAWKAAIGIARGMAAAQAVLNATRRIAAFWTNRETAATVRSTIATKAKTVATKAATVAMRIFNAVTKANPLGLLVVAITLLVGALVYLYKNNDKARKIMQAAWKGIKSAISNTVAWFRDVAWPAMKKAFQNLSDVAKALWKNGIRPAFKGIGGIISWWYKNVVKRYFGLVKAIFQGAAASAKWLWKGGIKPAFSGIAAVVKWMWARIKANFALLRAGMGLVSAGAKKLYDKGIRPAFNSISSKASWLWGKAKWAFGKVKGGMTAVSVGAHKLYDKGIRPAFNSISDKAAWLWGKVKWAFDKIKAGAGAVKTAMGKAKDGIKASWAKVYGAIKDPIVKALKWVQNTFVKKMRGFLGKIPGVSASLIPNISLKGFATGGWTGPGSKMTPAGVVHADEFVVNKRSRGRFERRNPGVLDHINRTGDMPGYAGGGRVADQRTSSGLRVWAAMMRKIIMGKFGVGTIGGYRPSDPYPDHPSGRALDIMVRGGKGDNIAAWLMQNQKAANLKYLLWKQRSWYPGRGWKGMENRGSPTQNHMDHIHALFASGAGNAKKLGGSLSADSVAALMQGGGGGMGFSLPAWASNPLKWVKGKFKSVMGGFDASKYGLAGKILPPVLGKLKGAITSKLKSAAENLNPLNIGQSKASNFSFGKFKAGTNQVVGKQLAAQMGWTGNQWTALRKLWQKESNWNHKAMNGSSGAYGIPQSLPGSKMASAGSDWRTNPATQIKWGLDYIKGRYRNPAAAWAHSQRTNWYADGGRVQPAVFDNGGTLAPGLNLVNNKLGKPEPLVRADQSRSVHITSGALKLDPSGRVYIEGVAEEVFDTRDNHQGMRSRMGVGRG